MKVRDKTVEKKKESLEAIKIHLLMVGVSLIIHVLWMLLKVHYHLGIIVLDYLPFVLLNALGYIIGGFCCFTMISKKTYLSMFSVFMMLISCGIVTLGYYDFLTWLFNPVFSEFITLDLSASDLSEIENVLQGILRAITPSILLCGGVLIRDLCNRFKKQ